MTKRTLWDHNPQLDRRLVELSAEFADLPASHREAEMARCMNEEFSAMVGTKFSPDSCRNRMKRIHFDKLGDKPPIVLMPTYEKYKDQIEGTVQYPEKRVNERTFEQHVNSMAQGRHKTLVLSDLHLPHVDREALDEAIQRNLTASLVILNGDVVDCYSISSFTKDQDVPIYLEIESCLQLFEHLSNTFPDSFIVGTIGNHETRVLRRVLPALPNGLEFLAKTNLLQVLARPFPSIVILDDWWVNVHDAIYAHAEASGGVDGAPATKTAEWFAEHREELGIPKFSVCCQAHSHRSAVIHRAAWTAIESGALCLPPSYMRTTKYKRPQQNGYVVVTQQNGCVVPYETREYIVRNVAGYNG